MTHRQHYLDANTRRYPRTLQEAFGPYQRGPVTYRSEEFNWTPVRIALTATYALAIIVLVAVL